MLKNAKKDFSEVTDDLRLGRSIAVKFRTGNVFEPKVIEMQLSCYVNPTINKSAEEYEKSVSLLRRKFNIIADDYISKNQNWVHNKKICDLTFTTGNLKKGCNKSVTMTLFVRQKENLTWDNIKKCLRNGMADMLTDLTECIRKEGFSCKKNKRIKKS